MTQLETVMTQEFVGQQLILLAGCLDTSEEGGRKRMVAVLQEILILPNTSISLICPLLEKLIANRKKAEAHLTGGGPPPPPLTPSEELALSLNKSRPVVDGIPEGTSSDFATSHNNSSDLVQFADGRIVLLDPPETTRSVTITDDEETTSAVTELESAGRPTENLAGDVHADEGPSTSTHNLSSELYKVRLLRQIKKTDMDMDLIQLQLEEKRLAIKKAKLEIELLEHRLKDMKK
ncbi:uncharacterized protein LOC127643528 [Xyrauchen texanus]|uniref:uncharacterized protein LOC127643528 n=1 Tax=Xyrauchen texanus TaxID=154827 RepID=UPI002242B45F|nr:uncharacterized protein LOC127643528 [Xyrauchen texanus]